MSALAVTHLPWELAGLPAALEASITAVVAGLAPATPALLCWAVCIAAASKRDGKAPLGESGRPREVEGSMVQHVAPSAHGGTGIGAVRACALWGVVRTTAVKAGWARHREASSPTSARAPSPRSAPSPPPPPRSPVPPVATRGHCPAACPLLHVDWLMTAHRCQERGIHCTHSSPATSLLQGPFQPCATFSCRRPSSLASRRRHVRVSAAAPPAQVPVRHPVAAVRRGGAAAGSRVRRTLRRAAGAVAGRGRAERAAAGGLGRDARRREQDGGGDGTGVGPPGPRSGEQGCAPRTDSVDCGPLPVLHWW